jgi:DNA repair exonuclease SbcCD nuclease subunit
MILQNPRTDIIDCRGVLVIGDPHVGSRRPGRRKDPDWPHPVLRKLEHLAALSREQGLATVILGDLFDRPIERDESLKARLVRILRSFASRPIVNVGNHDITHATLSDADSLALLGLCDVVDVVPRSGPVATIRLDGEEIAIGMTPFGQAIPDRLDGFGATARRRIWFTHHDIAFAGAYPGAVPPFAIEGCDLVVNGHLHKPQPAIRAGATLWANPGNITRRNVDCVDQRPAAWILGADATLVPHELPFVEDVFDLTGRIVDPASGKAVAGEIESAFVSLLRAEAATDMARSADGSVIKEEIEARFLCEGTSEGARAILRSLLAEAVERHVAAKSE